jgi:protein-disulfide isomerase
MRRVLFAGLVSFGAAVFLIPPAGPFRAGVGPAAALDTTDNLLKQRAKGSPQAPVTVYEMSDFQCPYCRRHAVETFPALEKRFVETGKVRWIFVNFPITSLHANAVAAAEFAMCAAQQDRFWPIHDLIYEHQEDWARLSDPTPYLLSLADSIRLPRASLRTCLEQGEGLAIVKRDAEGAARAGANSTPTFYIEGGLLVGAVPAEPFAKILDSIYTAKTGR